MRPQIGLRAALLATSLIVAPVIARAAPTFTAVTPSGAGAQPSITGANTLDCVLGATNCPATSIPANAEIIACVHADSGGTPPGAMQSLDASNNPLPDVWHAGPFNNDFGNAQTETFYAKTAGLTTGQKIRWTIPGSGVFATVDILYMTGQTADPQADGSASAHYGSGNPSATIASGSATGSQPNDIAFGCATAKFGGVALSQSAGFAAPPGQTTTNNLYVAGTAYDSGGTTPAFNYQATSASAQQPASAALLLMTTIPQPFSVYRAPEFFGASLPMLQMTTLGNLTGPDVAQANGLSNNTFNINVFTAAPIPTIDIAQDYFLGHPLYLDNNFFQGCNPANLTLQGLSVAVGECGGGYQATLNTFTSGNGGGQSFVGQAFSTDFYAEVTALWTPANTPGTWPAPIWTFTAGCLTVTVLPEDQWPGAPPGTELCIEIDGEYFNRNFGTGVLPFFWSVHNHFGSGHSQDFQTQVVFTPGASSFYQSPHRYGIRVKRATNTQPGGLFFYVDGVLSGSIPFTKFLFEEVAAGPVSSGATTVTLTMPVPSPDIVNGYVMFNERTNCILGPISNYTGTLASLQSATTCVGLAGDTYGFAPPPPPGISSGNYVSATGVATVVMNANPALRVGQTLGFAPTSTGGGNLSGSFPIIGVSGNTLTLQLPTGLGNSTITGGTICPPWFYGGVDLQHQAILDGFPNSPNQGTVYDLRVDQLPGAVNLRAF